MTDIKRLLSGTALALGTVFAGHGSAFAADVMCQTLANNHMLVSDAYVQSCVDAGVGNIGQGNQANDDFLNQLPNYGGYTTIGDQAWTQNGTSGTFSFSSALWNDYDELSIGFKFGTGNQPDEWFVYLMQDGVSSGTWSFVDVFDKGGGLSHVTLYGRDGGGGPPTGNIPEPTTLALLGIALLAVASTRRRT